jgi:hypothetical protein
MQEIEPGQQAWEIRMMPLRYMRACVSSASMACNRAQAGERGAQKRAHCGESAAAGQRLVASWDATELSTTKLFGFLIPRRDRLPWRRIGERGPAIMTLVPHAEGRQLHPGQV